MKPLNSKQDLDECWEVRAQGQVSQAGSGGSDRSQELGQWHLFSFSEKGCTEACRQAGSRADILLIWLAGFQQGVPGARLLSLLGLTGLGVGDPEA